MNVLHRSLGILALTVAIVTPALADPTTDIANAAAKFAALKSYKSTVTQSDGRTMTSETVNPDRSHTVMGPIEITMIGNAIYMKHNGTWQKETSSTTPMTVGAMMKLYGQNQATTTVADLGPKTVDGKALHAYLVTDTKRGAVSTVYLDSDGLFERLDVKQPNGSTIVRLSDFNAPISIEAPM